METLASVHPPVGATRLRSGIGHHGTYSSPKVTVPVPNPSPPASPTSGSRTMSTAPPTLSALPQLLLSASLPSVINSAASSTPLSSTLSSFTTYSPRSKTDQAASLLSSRDPISLPLMTNNFKRFVTVVGPVFWLQDRIEEIALWKRGTSWTTSWMAVYTLLCFYPRLIFLMPHLVLIGGILATYPYPSGPKMDGLNSSSSDSPHAAPPVESVPPWQANIQAIQNLMGAYSDFHAIVEPFVHHLCLTPAHFSPVASPSVATSPASASPYHSRSPYTLHLLAFLVVSFFPLLLIVHLPWFPVRSFCILGGWLPILVTHPYTQALIPVLRPALLSIVAKKVLLFGHRVSKVLFKTNPRLFTGETEVDDGLLPAQPKALSTVIQRFMDDDRLTDECWNSEMRQVELWENERYNGPMPPPAVMDDDSSSLATTMRKRWGKQHLRSSERGPWTRSRDGSNDISADGNGVGVDASGEVSNLTFSLAPGWSFVDSEDWRKDPQAFWSGCGCDEDGWVYTNDAWLGPRPAPYTSGGGSVTRRRRWVRRVWYDQKKADTDS